MTVLPCALCPVYLRPVTDRRTAEVGRACQDCLDLLAEELADLARRTLLLPELVAPRNGGAPAGSVHSHAGPRLPVSLDALSLTGPGAATPAVLLREEATRWAVIRSFGLYGPPEYGTNAAGRTYVHLGRHQTEVEALADWLVQRLPWAAARIPGLPEFARAVSVALAAVRRVTTEADPAGLGRPIGWCPAEGDEGGPCMGPLRASTWEDVIRCPTCGAEYHRGAGGWAALARMIKTTKTGLNRRNAS